MQSSASDSALRLSLYCKDPDSFPSEDCATFYQTNRGTWAVQGDHIVDPEAVAQLQALKPGETSVEIPAPLVESFVRKYVKENYGIDLG